MQMKDDQVGVKKHFQIKAGQGNTLPMHFKCLNAHNTLLTHLQVAVHPASLRQHLQLGQRPASVGQGLQFLRVVLMFVCKPSLMALILPMDALCTHIYEHTDTQTHILIPAHPMS